MLLDREYLKGGVVTVVTSIAVFWFLSKWPFTDVDVPVTSNLNTSYDYIIIGAGSAGSVLAARLSERSDVTVLLLEAGGHFNERKNSHVPSLWYEMLHTDFDWDYYTEPQVNACLGLGSKRSYWPRGRVLGGSSVINLLQYTVGNRFDYDSWAEQGAKGWSYKDILPYVKKAESIHVRELQDSNYHGKTGPMSVSDGNVTEMVDHYIKAGQELGYNIVDYNGEEQVGFSPYQQHINNGVRCSTASTYLKDAGHRENLHISIRSFVTKIHINKDKEASGVYVVKDHFKRFIKAKREVILSAGSINSPQILMLSGVGPEKQLKKHKIPVIADLPVGENLQDHGRLQLFTHIDKPITITPSMTSGIWNRLKYRLVGHNPIGKTSAEVASFMHTDPETVGKTFPNVQMNFFSSYYHANVERYNETFFPQMFSKEKRHYGFMTAMIMNHMQSKGTIRLRSSDPYDYPAIDPRYLSHPDDVRDFIRAIRIWEKFVSTPTMKSLGASPDQVKVDACAQHEFRSDNYWECVVRHFALTVYHPCCTCKMGDPADASTVLDPNLKVKGIKGLRVVDASVFPHETSGNVNVPVIMSAEKAADLIKNDI